MMARTHDLAAITALGGLLLVHPLAGVNTATIIVAIIANQFGGIAPDIDQPTAPIWRNLPVGGIFGKIIGKSLGGHRFLTHSLVGVGLFGLLTKFLLNFSHSLMPKVQIDLVWWAFMVGMVSHLVMDTFTKEGVPWLLPIPIKFGFPPVRAFRITTGKGVEKLLFILIFFVDSYYLSTHYPHLLSMFRQIVANS